MLIIIVAYVADGSALNLEDACRWGYLLQIWIYQLKLHLSALPGS